MTKNQEDKSTTYHDILNYCAENTSVWNSQSEFSNAINSLITVSNAIDTQAALQKQDITGIASDKTEKKEKLAILILNVSGAIQAYATTIKNKELYYKAKLTRSQLLKMRDTNISGTAELIVDLATGLGAVLVPFGITAAVVATLKTAAVDYKENYLSKPSSAIKNRKNITRKELPSLFNQADTLVKSVLLKLVVQFNDTDPDFVNKFIYNTYIGTRGIRHTRLSVTVTETINSDSSQNIVKPLAHALVVIENTGLSGNTDAKGKLTLTRVPETAKTVMVTSNGVTKSYGVAFERGKATHLNVEFAGEFVVPADQTVVAPVPVPVHV